jgi:hypothetical protein
MQIILLHFSASLQKAKITLSDERANTELEAVTVQAGALSLLVDQHAQLGENEVVCAIFRALQNNHTNLRTFHNSGHRNLSKWYCLAY